MENIQKINEKLLLPLIHNILSESGLIWNSVSGKRIQILSAGKINIHEGPDFFDMAMLIDGKFMIGDGEFHKKLQYWSSHKHAQDERYSNVKLHIAPKQQQSLIDFSCFETLLIDEEKICLNKNYSENSREGDFNSLIDLQEYALNRINRKSDEIQKLLSELGIKETLRFVVNSFLKGFQFRRRRPIYDSLSLENILQNIMLSNYVNLINDIYENIFLNNYQIIINSLINEKITGGGKQLMQEIFVNCILPFALCVAKSKIKTNLMIIFWSLPALNQYGILKRHFVYLPQDYVWQQQGMLEYIKEYGRLKD